MSASYFTHVRFHDQEELDAKYPPTPKRITREQFDYLLECLPPQKWVRRNRMESFQMMEYAYGDVTQICLWDYGREEGWTFHGPDSLTHEQIIERIATHKNGTDTTRSN